MAFCVHAKLRLVSSRVVHIWATFRWYTPRIFFLLQTVQHIRLQQTQIQHISYVRMESWAFVRRLGRPRTDLIWISILGFWSPLAAGQYFGKTSKKHIFGSLFIYDSPKITQSRYSWLKVMGCRKRYFLRELSAIVTADNMEHTHPGTERVCGFYK